MPTPDPFAPDLGALEAEHVQQALAMIDQIIEQHRNEAVVREALSMSWADAVPLPLEERSTEIVSLEQLYAERIRLA